MVYTHAGNVALGSFPAPISADLALWRATLWIGTWTGFTAGNCGNPSTSAHEVRQ